MLLLKDQEARSKPTFLDWLDACLERDAYVASPYRWGRRGWVVYMALHADEDTGEVWLCSAHMVDPMSKQGQKSKTRIIKVDLKQKWIIFTPDHFELHFPTVIYWNVRQVIDNVLQAYNDYRIGWYPSGERKGEGVLVLPWQDSTDPGERAMAMHSIPVTNGIRIDYKGNIINRELPRFRDSKKAAEKMVARKQLGKDLNKAARTLGFHTTFDLGGYPLPKDRSDKNLDFLNKQAQKLGYADVADAWAKGVPIMGEVDEQFIELHKQGLTGLLVQTRKEK